MKMEKKQTIILSVIGIATLIVAIIGATYAWFSATVTGNDSAKNVTVSSATLGVVFTDGDEISLTNALPGVTQTKTFTVASASGVNVSQPYTVNLDVTTNTFSDPTDLVYSLSCASDKTGEDMGTCGTTVSSVQVPTSGTNAVATGTIKPNETHTYTYTILFKSLDENQNDNQGKSFVGNIQVAAGTISS